MTLKRLPSELESVRNQILSGTIVPSYDTVSEQLLRLATPHEFGLVSPLSIAAPTPGDTAALASLGNNQNRLRGGSSNSKPRPKCDHCNRLGHTIDRCWKLHGRPPRQVNAAQIVYPDTMQTSPSLQNPTPSYDDFLRWCKTNQNSGSTTSVAHIGNTSVCLSQSSPLGLWVLDSGASDHVTGNKGFFSSISTSGFLPSINAANGSQTQSQGIGTVQILPSLSIASVLYDRSSGKTIGVGCESQGLYYFYASSTTSSATDSPLIIHAQLGHPGLPKLQKMGYRCYSHTLQRYLISADVTFFESIPYFESSQVTPEPLQESTHTPLSEVSFPLIPHHSSLTVVPPTTRPFQTYQRRQPTFVVPIPEAVPVPEVITDSPPTSSPTPDPIPQPESDLSIALQKGIRQTRNPSPYYIDLCYHRRSPLHYTCLSSLSSVSIPNTPGKALSHPEWRQAMIDEMCALQSSGTWELVHLPLGKSLVGCRWLYAVKVGPDGKIDRFKARFVAKGYTQIFGLDYSDTFSPVAKMASVRLLLAIAAIRHWPLHQLDIKMPFYMSPRAWFGIFSTVVQQFSMVRSEADHSVFYRHFAQGCIYLIVYVDDIVITGNDRQGILQLKQHLSNQFQTKDLGN
ncbi:uncharacterized protein LOC131646641 [Vicia villosa]|uniref:uncharacterized protein LOC131646641 n=1 Tax=Vicia villosa TaxID=3911 RepID=UPI00273B439C|nr:uncharacterized protein LOC131646641 [Vicia villosa]